MDPYPFFLKEHIALKPKEQKLIKVKAPFIDELDGNTYSAMLLKLKLQLH